MATKYKPRWGDNPEGDRPSNRRPVFDREDAVKMAALAGLSGPDYVDDLLVRLHVVEEALYVHRYTDKTAVSLLEQRAALDVMFDAATRLETMLGEVDKTTLGRIFANYPAEYDQSLLFHDDLGHLTRLRQAILQAQAQAREEEARGRPSALDLKFAAVKLAELWESLTGERFLISAKGGRDAPARFVEHGLRKLARNDNGNDIGTALRHAVMWVNKRSSKTSD